VTSKNGRR